MTIREVERATGLTRANIRFYEAQGLIVTERRENNYREYTREHTEILLRVKLLRALGMSLEQIKALQNGQDDLLTALDRQIEILEKEQQRLGQSQRVCRQMRGDGVRYETLDARRYLDALENPTRSAASVMARDVPPRVFAPWQRYWARGLDSLACSMAVLCIYAWASGGVLLDSSIWSTILGMAMMLVLEPVQLWLWGTTLGKWIFGIRVVHVDGRNLRLGEAFSRTWRVLLYGQGLKIVGISIWRLWKSYVAYDNGEELLWEEDSELTVKDQKPLRYAAAAAAAAVIFCAAVLISAFAQLPQNRGDLTAQQFCENYRKAAESAGVSESPYFLQDDGTWLYQPNPNTAFISLDANGVPPDFQFTTENGVITSLFIWEDLVGQQEGVIVSRENQMSLASLAILMAQEDYNLLAREEQVILSAISEHPFEDFTVTVCGLTFTYDVEISGYWIASGGYLVEDNDPDTIPSYSMRFTIEKAQ